MASYNLCLTCVRLKPCQCDKLETKLCWAATKPHSKCLGHQCFKQRANAAHQWSPGAAAARSKKVWKGPRACRLSQPPPAPQQGLWALSEIQLALSSERWEGEGLRG